MQAGKWRLEAICPLYIGAQVGVERSLKVASIN